MQKTSIEWTDFTANPIKYRRKSDGKAVWACVKHSTGCAHCYAESIALRFDRGKQFTVANMQEVEPYLDEAECRKMLTAKKIGGKQVSGSRCFVGDMTDVFGEWVPDEMLDRLFAVFALRPDITFQVLTKRAERMADYFGDGDRFELSGRDGALLGEIQHRNEDYMGPMFPLPNVWLGVSVEDQQRADERIPHLLRTPAAVRFLSCEPLLGPLHDKSNALFPGDPSMASGWCWADLDWTITGCESRGPKAGRFVDGYAAASLSIIEQCQVAGVAVFEKQMPVNGRVSHDMSEWPEPHRVRQFPTPATPGSE
jgi:protein gp37